MADNAHAHADATPTCDACSDDDAPPTVRAGVDLRALARAEMMTTAVVPAHVIEKLRAASRSIDDEAPAADALAPTPPPPPARKKRSRAPKGDRSRARARQTA